MFTFPTFCVYCILFSSIFQAFIHLWTAIPHTMYIINTKISTHSGSNCVMQRHTYFVPVYQIISFCKTHLFPKKHFHFYCFQTQQVPPVISYQKGKSSFYRRFSCILFLYYLLYLYKTALNASSKSSIISSIFSVPMDRRIVFGLIPCSSSSFSLS